MGGSESKSGRYPAYRHYSELVNGHHDVNDYQSRLVELIEHFPDFIPSYLELLEQTHAYGRRHDYERLLSFTRGRLGLNDPAGFLGETDISVFGYEELFALSQIVKGLQPTDQIDAQQGDGFARIEGAIADFLARVSPDQPKGNLQVIRNDVEVEAFRNELKDRDHFWFANSERQKSYTVHKYAQAIILRALHHFTEEPVLIDGANESIRTEVAKYFPATLNFIEQAAADLGSGLGRVALVRLAPGCIAYRHADMEVFLKGRARYHLAIDVKEGNIMFAGEDILMVENGQLIKYANMTMHKAYNESDDWRVHVIFDVLPQK